MRRVLLAVLDLFRAARAVLLPPSCRFTPTCSVFAREAIERLPLGEAFTRIAFRLLRCHPFHSGGHDPLPSARM
ncbi:MAG: membrane protein insertion efficiency factor YidD [Elusimicrobiota bacterium]